MEGLFRLRCCLHVVAQAVLIVAINFPCAMAAEGDVGEYALRVHN